MQEFVASVFTNKIDELFLMKHTNVFALKNASHIGPLSSVLTRTVENLTSKRTKIEMYSIISQIVPFLVAK